MRSPNQMPSSMHPAPFGMLHEPYSRQCEIRSPNQMPSFMHPAPFGMLYEPYFAVKFEKANLYLEPDFLPCSSIVSNARRRLTFSVQLMNPLLHHRDGLHCLNGSTVRVFSLNYKKFFHLLAPSMDIICWRTWASTGYCKVIPSNGFTNLISVRKLGVQFNNHILRIFHRWCNILSLSIWVLDVFHTLCERSNPSIHFHNHFWRFYPCSVLFRVLSPHLASWFTSKTFRIVFIP